MSGCSWAPCHLHGPAACWLTCLQECRSTQGQHQEGPPTSYVVCSAACLSYCLLLPACALQHAGLGACRNAGAPRDSTKRDRQLRCWVQCYMPRLLPAASCMCPAGNPEHCLSGKVHHHQQLGTSCAAHMWSRTAIFYCCCLLSQGATTQQGMTSTMQQYGCMCIDRQAAAAAACRSVWASRA
jgi:hypothetical protein